MSSARIVILDDNATSRALVRIYLMNEPFEVVEAHSGEGALELIRAVPPAAVIADYHLEGMDGLELTRQLKADSSPWIRGIPVIMLTGDDQPQVERHALAAGASAFLRKPVTPAKLKEALRQVLP